jgi:uncharacterized protein (TIGR03435 family)
MLQSRLLGAVGIVAVVGAIAAVTAQTPADPAFEVASVKLNKSGDAGIGGFQGGTTEFRAMNVPLRVLIGRAYGIRQDSGLIGGPAWLDTDRFDIVGKMPQPNSPSMAMVRTLLADRFKLVTHRESRELPIYALVVARSDGRLGSKLHPSPCVAGRTPNGTPCGDTPGPGLFVGSGVALSILIDASLSSLVQRTVADRTGLTGTFDIDLHWLPDNPPVGPQPDTPPPSPGDPPLVTALQEQLGLKLQSTTGPVDVLVIDHVEHPTEN